MKANITLIFSLIVFASFAQPTVTTDWLPQIGDQLSSAGITVEEAIDPGMPGAGVVYDFSGVTLPDTLDIAAFTVVDPATTPFSDFYQDADIALAIPEFGIYSYSKITDGCLEDLGSTVGGITFQIYTNARSFACSPVTYLNTFSDEFAGTSEFLGVVTHITGTNEVIADGWGTLLMPGGGSEIGNVLRLKSEEVTIDSTDLGSGIREKVISETTTYNFISADYKNVLVSMSETYETQIGMSDGIPNDTIQSGPFYDFSYDPEPREVGTASTQIISADEIGLNVFPNPAGELLNVRFEATDRDMVNMIVHDLSGRQVLSSREASTPGMNALPIDVSMLEPGMYILTVRNAKFSSSVKFTRR